MLKIGLTGGIASGKSVAAATLKNLGVPILDADIAVRELSRSGTETFSAIKKLLGQDVVRNHHELDRRKIRQIIFSDETKRKAIEAILHPAVRQWLLDETDALGNNAMAAPYCILLVPLLIESGMTDLVDIIAVIDCDKALQIERLMTRDRCDEAEARQILHSQTDRQQRLAKADIIIENNASQEKLEKQMLNLHNTWKQKTER